MRTGHRTWLSMPTSMEISSPSFMVRTWGIIGYPGAWSTYKGLEVRFFNKSVEDSPEM